MTLSLITSFIKRANDTLLRHVDAPVNGDDERQLLEFVLQLQPLLERSGSTVEADVIHAALQLFDTIGCNANFASLTSDVLNNQNMTGYSLFSLVRCIYAIPNKANYFLHF